jgi:hypothetical protein
MKGGIDSNSLSFAGPADETNALQMRVLVLQD